MRFLSFSSGSCGNCYLLLHEEEGCATSGVLIDAGVSIRRMKKILESQSLDLDCFQSVLVTHDHGDHIRNLGSICKRLSRPVYTTSILQDALAWHPFTRLEISGCRRDLLPRVWNPVAEGIEVQYFEVPHARMEPRGRGHRGPVLRSPARRHADGRLRHPLRRTPVRPDDGPRACDRRSPAMGPPGRHRGGGIQLRRGHAPQRPLPALPENLSNDACGDAIRQFMHPGLRNLFLCHLSGNNNTPRLAYDNARAVLEDFGVDPGTVHLRVLERGIPSPLLLL